MALLDFLKPRRQGRRPAEPTRDTQPNPNWLWSLFGGRPNAQRTVLKPTPRNLRRFSTTPYARAAINAIKSPIAMLNWDVVPIHGVEMNSELERQIAITKICLERPNNDDSFRTMTEQVIEDVLCGAGALEMQLGPAERPLWLYPADGLSIRLNPAWTPSGGHPRYEQEVARGQLIALRNDELIYLRPNPSTYTPFGLGPLEVAFETISRMLGVSEFAGDVASNSRPSVMLDMGESASPEFLATMRAYWTNEIEGQGKMPIVATKGGTVNRLYPEGDDGTYLKYKEMLKAEIAVSFDLSPQNLGVERDVNRNTAEVAESRDLAHAIKPMADLYASHITREAIQGKLGFSQLRLSFPSLESEDESELVEMYAKEYANNATTPNAYLTRRGLPPLESEFGDMLKVEADIAANAARSAGQILDPTLAKNMQPVAAPAQKGV
jgi:hypothetical protein